MENALPAIPPKRYFTIGEVSELCGVKPYVLRYWEQEFTQLRPMKRRGNRRYYQHHEVLLIRRIRDLLYEQGFTISGARNRLTELGGAAAQAEAWEAAEAGDRFEPDTDAAAELALGLNAQPSSARPLLADVPQSAPAAPAPVVAATAVNTRAVPVPGRSLRDELIAIRSLLEPWG
ncbi:MAG: MerR family transcriptional regulator [Burkholderiaceae bacterium]|nr:MerR family transcriptional regulator [Burkholderiaceae bacterium]